MVEPVPPHLGGPVQTTTNLKLVNHNDFVIEDRYDGVPYTFHPDTTTIVPADAALHMFNWSGSGSDMSEVEKHVTKRWGWNTAEMQASGNRKKFFGNLEFKPVVYKLVEVVEQEEGEHDELVAHDADDPPAPQHRLPRVKVRGSTPEAPA